MIKILVSIKVTPYLGKQYNSQFLKLDSNSCLFVTFKSHKLCSIFLCRLYRREQKASFRGFAHCECDCIQYSVDRLPENFVQNASMSQKTLKLLIDPRNLVTPFRQILFLTQYKPRKLQHSLLFFSHIGHAHEHNEIIGMIQIVGTGIQFGALLIPRAERPNYFFN